MTSLTVASLTVGDELLDGRIVDTNSQRLVRALFERGATCSEIRSVPDDAHRITAALRELCALADVVVTSGGLGPTTDDITAASVAAAAGVGIALHEPTWKKIETLFAAREMELTENNRGQAMLPVGAVVYENAVGLCPAFCISVGGTPVYCMPGVPREYDYLLTTHVVPAMTGAAVRPRAHRTVRTMGMSESQLGTLVDALDPALTVGCRVQYRASFPENHVRFVTERASQEEAEQAAEAVATATQNVIGRAAYAVSDDNLSTLLLGALRQGNATVAFAESCTGGLMGKEMVDVPGASAAFLGSAVVYANAAKTALLDVDATLIEEAGAVSEAVATQMAEGARRRFGADFAVSVTGIAGPDGGTEDKPVGTVCFGLAGPAGTTVKTRRLPNMGRERIRAMASRVALLLLYRFVQGAPAATPDKGSAA